MQATENALAAMLDNGSVVSWGGDAGADCSSAEERARDLSYLGLFCRSRWRWLRRELGPWLMGRQQQHCASTASERAADPM